MQWLPVARRAPALAAAALALAVSSTACTGPGLAPASSQRGPSATSAAAPAPYSALSTLYSLAVADLAPPSGYAEQRFGPRWADTDNNSCDTFDDVLRRDLTGVETADGDGGCVVLAGTLVDPYTGTTAGFTRGGGQVVVDHVVSLVDAWRTGMNARPAAERLAFANDPMNLYAVTRSVASDKDGADAASWLPPAGDFRCTYVATQVGVKRKYGLWVTSAERAAMAGVLRRCPNLRAPSGGGPTSASVAPTRTGGTPTPTPTATPTATPTPTPAPTPSASPTPPSASSPPPTRPSAPPTTSPPTPTPTLTRTPGSPLDPRFDNCRQARKHGYGPYYLGRDPEYFWYPDTDFDGVVCE